VEAPAASSHTAIVQVGLPCKAAHLCCPAVTSGRYKRPTDGSTGEEQHSMGLGRHATELPKAAKRGTAKFLRVAFTLPSILGCAEVKGTMQKLFVKQVTVSGDTQEHSSYRWASDPIQPLLVVLVCPGP